MHLVRFTRAMWPYRAGETAGFADRGLVEKYIARGYAVAVGEAPSPDPPAASRMILGEPPRKPGLRRDGE
jgi:hypothetical protein